MSNLIPFERRAIAVDDPEISEVLDLQTGEHIPHYLVIGVDYEKAIQLRMELRTLIKRKTPLFACSLCGVAVYLVSRREERRFFFRHTLEDGRCPARTRGELSQDEIDARKYNGVKESQRHRQMKDWVAESLQADPQFSKIAKEKRWSGALTSEWRQPDVRAIYQGTAVVFEIQLSTTYVNVIAERRDFYLREGGILLWVFANFDVEARRLTQDDVFFNNNRNAFVVSRATRDASVRQKRFFLECVWATPMKTGVSELQRKLVAFDQLTLEQDKQRVYYFDFDNAKQALIKLARAQELQRRAPMREKIEASWLSHTRTDQPDIEGWADLQQQCSSEGIVLPDFHAMPRPLVNALYSAKYGRVIGWKVKNFIEVAHLIENGHKEYLHYFRLALSAYNRAEQIIAEDKSGKWRQRVKRYKASIAQSDPAYAPDNTHATLVEFLFPEICGNA